MMTKIQQLEKRLN